MAQSALQHQQKCKHGFFGMLNNNEKHNFFYTTIKLKKQSTYHCLYSFNVNNAIAIAKAHLLAFFFGKKS